MRAVNYCSTCAGRSARSVLILRCELQVKDVLQLLIYFRIYRSLALKAKLEQLRSRNRTAYRVSLYTDTLFAYSTLCTLTFVVTQ